MIKSKKKEVKKVKKAKKAETKEEKDEHAGGISLDDAFADSDDVEYGKSKSRKEKKKKASDEEIEEELEEAEKEIEEIARAESGNAVQKEISIKASKPIAKVKKGDKIRVDIFF